MKTDLKVTEPIFDTDEHVLFLPLLSALNEVAEDDKELFLREILKRYSEDSSEGNITESVRYTLNVYKCIEPIPEYCTGFKTSVHCATH